MNISKYPDDKTARTSSVIARQRAENLYALGVKSVLELCVGPSALTLAKEYGRYQISSCYNDIDPRWKTKSLNWKIGDCFRIDFKNHIYTNWLYHAVVFAPPLSRGCSGRREDSLTIDEVTPSYKDFLQTFKWRSGYQPRIGVLVLPARSLATKQDRSQFYKLLSQISQLGLKFEIVEMYDKVRKYIDIYITRK